MSSRNFAATAGVTIALSATQAGANFSSWTVPLQIPELMGRCGWSAANAGLVLTFQMLLTGTVVAALSPFVPRFKPKLFAAAGAFTTVLGFLIVSFGQSSAAPVIVGLLLSGLGQGACSTAAAALTAVAADRTRSYSIAMTSSIVFYAASLALLPLFRSPFAAASSIYVACAVAMTTCLLAIVVAPVPHGHSQGKSTLSSQLTLTRRAILPVAGIFLLFAANMAVYAFAENLGQLWRFSESAIAMVLSVAAILAAFGPQTVAAFGRARDVRRFLAIGFVGTGVCLFLTCVPIVHPTYVVALFGQSIGQTAMATLVFDLCFRADSTGRLSSLTGGAVTFGCATGPALGGALIGYGPAPLGAVSLGIAVAGWLLVDRFARWLSQHWVPTAADSIIASNV
jgi:predicted MFS family arabinose efflux permease